MPHLGTHVRGIKHVCKHMQNFFLLSFLKAIILAEESFPVCGGTGTLSLDLGLGREGVVGICAGASAPT